jgi:hypothetical protein
VAFAVVEQKEPHAGRMAFADIEQPATFAARLELAKRLRDELEVPLPIYVDGMDDASRALFSDLPSPAFVIRRDGLIVQKFAWADPEPLGQALDALLLADRESGVPEVVAMDQVLDRRWFDHRLVRARQLLAHGRPGLALEWLAVPTEAQLEASVRDTLRPLVGEPRAQALAALTRLQALAAQPAELRAGAVAAAQAAVAVAFAGDWLRLAAARVEIAEAAVGLPVQGQLWQEALAALPAGAPEGMRAWLEGRRGKAR